ncbi:hypothetical protein T05_3740 [Trichinella murrelli]|uniref:Uncharacterized protein n=1 Tax=Trichinella murrelli TaxID=144512 RepID=A0A0V0UG53_9BILA|nr:hypothetical protein T05_3740 [Trichinella murrelli]
MKAITEGGRKQKKPDLFYPAFHLLSRFVVELILKLFGIWEQIWRITYDSSVGKLYLHGITITGGIFLQ